MVILHRHGCLYVSKASIFLEINFFGYFWENVSWTCQNKSPPKFSFFVIRKITLLLWSSKISSRKVVNVWCLTDFSYNLGTFQVGNVTPVDFFWIYIALNLVLSELWSRKMIYLITKSQGESMGKSRFWAVKKKNSDKGKSLTSLIYLLIWIFRYTFLC